MLLTSSIVDTMSRGSRKGRKAARASRASPSLRSVAQAGPSVSGRRRAAVPVETPVPPPLFISPSRSRPPTTPLRAVAALKRWHRGGAGSLLRGACAALSARHATEADFAANVLEMLFDSDLAHLGNAQGYLEWHGVIGVSDANGTINYLPMISKQVQMATDELVEVVLYKCITFYI